MGVPPRYVLAQPLVNVDPVMSGTQHPISSETEPAKAVWERPPPNTTVEQYDKYPNKLQSHLVNPVTCVQPFSVRSKERIGLNNSL